MIPWLPRLKSDVFISWADIWILSVLGLFQVSIRCCVWGWGGTSAHPATCWHLRLSLSPAPFHPSRSQCDGKRGEESWESL